MPVLSLLTSHRKILWYMTGGSFLLHFVWQPVLGMLNIHFSSYISFPVAGGFVAYALFGYLVATGPDWSGRNRLILYAVTLCSTVFAVLYTCRVSAAAGKTVKTMVAYEYYPSALMAASLFIIFRHLKDRQPHPKIQQLLRTLSGCNMGVWLTHSIGMTIGFYFLRLPPESYIWCFVMPFVIYICCAAGTWVVKKIPILKYIV